MVRIWMGLLLALAAAVAAAAKPPKLPEQAELSMLVTGLLELAPDGSVVRWDVDDPDQLPDFVVDLTSKAAPHWKFEPLLVGGKQVESRVRASLRVVARRNGEDSYRLSIRSAHFGDAAMSAEERHALDNPTDVHAIQMGPPRYPAGALNSGTQGTVHLVLKIGRDGAVEDVVVEQVNLRTIGNERQMQGMRDALSKAAVPAARKWSFRVPTAGEEADKDYWSVRVPVDFAIGRPGAAATKPYGRWDAYIPGPLQRAPWTVDEDASPEAMVAGRLYPEGRQRKLLTPLQPG